MNMESEAERARRVRRSAWLFGCVALAFYVGFILLSVFGNRG